MTELPNELNPRAIATAILLEALTTRISAGNLSFEEADTIVRSIYVRGLEDDKAVVDYTIKVLGERT